MAKQPIGSVKKHRGRWTARVTFTHPITRKRKEWRRVPHPNTKANAGELIREKLRKIQSGIYDDEPAEPQIDPGTILFGDAARAYLEACVCAPVYAENGEKIKGMQDHKGVRSTVENVLIPALGKRPLVKIHRNELVALRDRRLSDPKLRGGRNVVETKGKRSLARVNREMSTLRAVLNFAIDSKWIPSNPMKTERRGVSPLVLTKAENARERILTRAEEKELLKAFDETAAIHRSKDFVVMALDTGMRRSELLLLEQRDVDLAAGVLRLRAETTKSKKTRVIPMSGRVRAIVSARMTRKPKARIFSELTPTILRDDFNAARVKAKIPDFRLHDCRATLSTRLQQAGISEAEIARMTGHRVRITDSQESAPTLRKHYLRLTPETVTRVTSAIDGGEQPN